MSAWASQRLTTDHGLLRESTWDALTFPFGNSKLSPMTLTAREKADRANQALAADNASAIRELLPAKLGVVSVTVTETDVTFSGGPHGDHALALVVTNEARALAHWQGYAQVAGINWAAPQRAHEARWCCECDATIKQGQPLIGADFGDYCSAECAEQGYENYMEGQEQ